jgi:hypothetical protein
MRLGMQQKSKQIWRGKNDGNKYSKNVPQAQKGRARICIMSKTKRDHGSFQSGPPITTVSRLGTAAAIGWPAEC